MAEPDTHLIDAHLAEMAERLARRPDREDLLAEARDHLMTAMEQRLAAGLSPEDAQRAALARFGSAGEVGDALASNGRARPAVPSRFTRLAGMLAQLIAPALVLGTAGWIRGSQIEAAEGWGDHAATWWSLGSIGFMLATFSSLVLAAALVRRRGGAGALGGVSVALIGLGAVCSIITWAVAVWMPLLTLGWMLLAITLLSDALLPRREVGALVVGLLLGFAALFTTANLADGVDVIAPLAFRVALVVASLGAIGWATVRIGRWLASETPVDLAPVATT